MTDPVQRINELRQFLVETSPTVPIWQFLPGLIATALLCYLLSLVYRQFGQALSNRENFGRNFVMIGMTTMLIISIVKSSLALSLGLVGALSIVRFRTAIKEPEELAYLFLVIGVGLGFGANQWLITVSAFAIIVALIWVKHRTLRSHEASNFFLTVRTADSNGLTLSDITDSFKDSCRALDLKRFDKTADGLEVAYLVSFSDYRDLDHAKQALESRDPSIDISFLEGDGIN